MEKIKIMEFYLKATMISYLMYLKSNKEKVKKEK